MKWLQEREDLKILSNVRNALRHIRYGRIELWRLFGANITLQYWEGALGKTKISAVLIQLINLFFLTDFKKYFRHRHSTFNYKGDERPLIIEALSDDEKLRGFWLPVAQALGKNKSIIVTEDIAIYEKYKQDFNVLLLAHFSIVEWLKSRFFIAYSFFTHFIFYLTKKQKEKITPLSILSLFSVFIEQINRVVKFKWVIETIKPSGYLTIWDWYAMGSAGTAVFKSYALPTFTFIHGAAGKDALVEFVPLNADYIFSWGKHNTQNLIELGVKREQILEDGCPRMTAFLDTDAAISSDGKKIIMILLTANVDPVFVYDIKEIAAKYQNDFDIQVRLHPSKSKEELHEALINAPLTFITKHDESIEKSIEKAFVIVVDTSTAGFDAINRDKPVFVIDSSPIKKNQDVMADVIKAGAALFSPSFSDFVQRFDHFISESDTTLKATLTQNRRHFIQHFVAEFSDASAKKMVQSMQKITHT
jgi:hypothetical protein